MSTSTDKTSQSGTSSNLSSIKASQCSFFFTFLSSVPRPNLSTVDALQSNPGIRTTDDVHRRKRDNADPDQATIEDESFLADVSQSTRSGLKDILSFLIDRVETLESRVAKLEQAHPRGIIVQKVSILILQDGTLESLKNTFLDDESNKALYTDGAITQEGLSSLNALYRHMKQDDVVLPMFEHNEIEESTHQLEKMLGLVALTLPKEEASKILGQLATTWHDFHDGSSPRSMSDLPQEVREAMKVLATHGTSTK